MRRRAATVFGSIVLGILSFLSGISLIQAASPPAKGVASWYGEQHRGKLMANGRPFNPDKLTAASWFYPLGTKVQVKLEDGSSTPPTVTVTITDRGPARRLVRAGRIIDLSHATFRKLAHPDQGLVAVTVTAIRKEQAQQDRS